MLTLSADYSADLDSKNPAWDVNADQTDGYDIVFHGSERYSLESDSGESDMAVVFGSPSYKECVTATGYTDSLSADEAKPGVNLCVRTSEKRFAFVEIKKRADDRSNVQLAVTVWDPQFE